MINVATLDIIQYKEDELINKNASMIIGHEIFSKSLQEQALSLRNQCEFETYFID